MQNNIDLIIEGQKAMFTSVLDNWEDDLERQAELDKSVAGNNRCLYMDEHGWQCPGKIPRAHFLGCDVRHGGMINSHVNALKNYVFSADEIRGKEWRRQLTVGQAEHYYSNSLI